MSADRIHSLMSDVERHLVSAVDDLVMQQSGGELTRPIDSSQSTDGCQHRERFELADHDSPCRFVQLVLAKTIVNLLFLFCFCSELGLF